MLMICADVSKTENHPEEAAGVEKKYCCQKHLKLFEQASNSIR
jgi:hypothetical protein